MAIIKVGDKATAPSVRPSLLLDFANSKTLDPRINFARSSTGTYYDGKTKIKCEENLQHYSESINNWGKVASSVQSNAIVAPDGTLTADKLIEDTSTATTHGLTGANTPFIGLGFVTASWYAKAGERTWITVNLSNVSISGNVYNFDLANGTFSHSDTQAGWADHSATMTDVGDGWYRCTITGRLTSTTARTVRFDYRLASAENVWTYTGDGTSGSYVWGLQIETGDKARHYVKNDGTDYVVNYISKLMTANVNQPRFDHDPATGESKGLLLETSNGVNHYTASSILPGSRFNNAYNISNYSIAPDGTHSAKLYYNDNGVAGYSYSGFSNVIGNGTWTLSFYLKKAYGSGGMVVGVAGAAGILRTYIDNNTTTQTQDNSNMDNISFGSVDVGSGWKRYWITGTSTNDAGYQEIQFDVQGANTGWLAWGLQIENSNAMSSYIPTSGSSVTRSGESCSVPIYSDSDWYSKGKGTLYAEGAVNEFTTSQGIAGFRDSSDIGATWNGIYVSSAGGVIISNYSYRYGGSQQSNLGTTGGFVQMGEFARGAMSFSSNYSASAISKSSTVETTASTTNTMSVPEHDVLYVGRLGSSYSIRNGHVKKVAYYPEALDVDELTALVEE